MNEGSEGEISKKREWKTSMYSWWLIKYNLPCNACVPYCNPTGLKGAVSPSAGTCGEGVAFFEGPGVCSGDSGCVYVYVGRSMSGDVSIRMLRRDIGL